MIEKLINNLKVQSIKEPLIRLGSNHDGGYLVPDILDSITSCISPGVENNYSFEQDLVNKNITCYLYDNSVDVTPPEKMFFYKKHLDIFSDDRHITLDEILQDFSSDNLLLQMDIEGSEYKVLHSSSLLHKFKIAVIEFHALENILQFKPIFDKLLNIFYVVHIHPNNYAPVAYVEGCDIPTVLEFTFVRKDSCTLDNKELVFPHPLDRPNNKNAFDIVLPKCWR